MDNGLICNFNHCRKVLKGDAWVTSCSHVFCDNDGSRELQKALMCPACDHPLTGKYDAVKVDLNPSEEYKSMVLAGQRPDIIQQICTRALAFWSYQVNQELSYLEYMAKQSHCRQKELEKHYESMVQKAKTEISLLKDKVSALEKDIQSHIMKQNELSEKLTERDRQNQKLYMLYESVRRKFVSPAYYEKRMSTDGPRNTFGMSTANDLLRPVPSDKSTTFEEERDFVLKPVPTPTTLSTPRFHPFEQRPQQQQPSSANQFHHHHHRKKRT